MATFTPCIRTDKEQNAVYIRISHNSKTDYIKTEMLLHKSGIRKGRIADATVLANCAIAIKKYIEKINRVNTSNWTVQELKQYLTSETGEISFSAFARTYIEQMQSHGRTKPASNYISALNSLEKHCRGNLNFSQITSKTLREWIKSLETTRRAKQMYPVIIKKLFDEGCLEYNDYERDIIRIPARPFKVVKIPESDVPDKRNIEIEPLRRILGIKPESVREQLARDIALLVLCLVGINTVDLYNLEKPEFRNGKICYNRTKTQGKRRDKAYIEISVPEKILPLLDKYRGKKYLLNFREKYSEPGNFSRAVNIGLKSLCTKAQTHPITVYWLRHTWATVAQNQCHATTELVAFALNHRSAHRVTEDYIKKDYTPIDRLNKKVLTEIFGTFCSTF
jgi:integrase